MHLTLHRHLHHRSAAWVRRCSCVTHPAESRLIVHHLHRHALQLHLLHRIHLLVHHVVDRHLRLSSALLRCHWKVIWLIHRELILRNLLLLSTLGLHLFGYLIHLYLVSHAWWRLGVLNVHYIDVLGLMDVVLRASTCSAARVRVDWPHPVVVGRVRDMLVASRLAIAELPFDLIGKAVLLRDVGAWAFTSWILETALSVYRCKEWVIVILAWINIIIVVYLSLCFFPFTHYIRIHLVWSWLRKIEVIGNPRAAVSGVDLLLLERVSCSPEVDQARVILTHHVLLTWLALCVRDRGSFALECIVIGVWPSLSFNSSLREGVLALCHVAWCSLLMLGLLLSEHLRRQDSLVVSDHLVRLLASKSAIDIYRRIVFTVLRS